VSETNGHVFHEAVRAAKREILVHYLRVNGGNRGWTAKMLGTQRTYVCRLIREYRIEIASLARNKSGPRPGSARAVRRAGAE
jgi:DNA-binding NtrC family response regulator